MLIVLPPSETKSTGGDHPPLNLAELSFPELNPIREDIAQDLVALTGAEALTALGISEKLAGEVKLNNQLWEQPTAPAITRYTGVLYDALRPQDLTSQQSSSIAIGSALFGVVGAHDMIPHYRLSGGSKLPRRNDAAPAPTMKKRWGSAITEVLADYPGLVVDLRSGTYQNLGKLKGATKLRVETPDGKVVSHFNKHYKGVLTREVCLSGESPETAEDFYDLTRELGFETQLSGTTITMTVER